MTATKNIAQTAVLCVGLFAAQTWSGLTTAQRALEPEMPQIQM